MAVSSMLATVYDASYQRLVAQLIVVCGSQVEAEDAVQEAFVKAISQGSRWERVENPEAWLRTVAINSLRTRWRRGSALRRLLPKVPGPVQPLEPSADRLALSTALRKVKPEFREVLALHYIADLPLAQIAEELDLPVGTVKSRLARAREQLGVQLGVKEADHA